jgi:uncharacterized CHY-type Zn-finger protein
MFFKRISLHPFHHQSRSQANDDIKPVICLMINTQQHPEQWKPEYECNYCAQCYNEPRLDAV